MIDIANYLEKQMRVEGSVHSYVCADEPAGERTPLWDFFFQGLILCSENVVFLRDGK